jgi:hypothetical protein
MQKASALGKEKYNNRILAQVGAQGKAERFGGGRGEPSGRSACSAQAGVGR